MAKIVYSSGINRFVTVVPGTPSGAYSDNDCSTWTPINLGLSSRPWTNVFVTHSGQTPFFIATMSGNTIAARSSDGINWTGFQFPTGGSFNPSRVILNKIANIDNHIIALPYNPEDYVNYQYTPYWYSFDYGMTWNSGDTPRISGINSGIQTVGNEIATFNSGNQKYFVVQAQQVSPPYQTTGCKIDYNTNNISRFQEPLTVAFSEFQSNNKYFIYSRNADESQNSGYIGTTGNWNRFKLLEGLTALEYKNGLWVGVRFKTQNQYDLVKENFLLSGEEDYPYPGYSQWKYDSLPLINNDQDYTDIISEKSNLYLLSSSGYKKMAKGTITKNIYEKPIYTLVKTLNGDATDRSFGLKTYIENDFALIVGISGNTANFLATGRYNISCNTGVWSDKIPLNITGTNRLFTNACFNKDKNIIFIPSAINTGNGNRTSVSILTGSGINWQHVSNIYSITNGENEIYSMATNSNGSRLVVGMASMNNSSGIAYVYSGANANWNLSSTLTGGNDIGGSYTYFGKSVSINDNGNVIAIGASNAFGNSGGILIFTGNGQYTLTSKLSGLNSNLGEFVRLNNSGNIVAGCGVYGQNTYIGNGEIFGGNGNSWERIKFIKDTNFEFYNGSFGAFGSNGDHFAMGGGGSSKALISLFNKYNNRWIHTLNFTGTSISVSENGSQIIVGNTYEYDPVGGIPYGQVNIFQKTGIVTSSSLDNDTLTYVSNIESADGQSLENGVVLSINSFITGCKGDGIWDAIKSSSILAGARTLSGALMPLKGSAPTNYNFISSDYNRKSGLKGDGATKYLDTNVPSNFGIVNNKHLSVYVTNTGAYRLSTAANNLIGAEYLSGVVFRFTTLLFNQTNSVYRYYIDSTENAGNQITFATLSPGLVGAARFGNTGIKYIYTSGNTPTTGQDFTVFQRGTGEANKNLYVFRRYYNPGSYWASSSTGYANSTLSFYSIGENIDLAKLNLRVSGLMSDLNQYIT